MRAASEKDLFSIIAINLHIKMGYSSILNYVNSST